MRRHIAVDFDGTLATYYVTDTRPYDPSVVGEPIPRMVERVRRWLAEGDEVTIFTARVNPRCGLSEVALAEKAVKAFCVEQFGRELPVTCMKDPEFEEVWDDRAVRVRTNEGLLDVYLEKSAVDEDVFGEFLR